MRPAAGGWSYTEVTEADLPMLQAWLSRPHVSRWWGEPPTLEQLEADLREDRAGGVVRTYVAWHDGVPAGYIQCYRVMGSGEDWWPDETDPGARGIDFYLADGDRLGQGLGRAMVRAFVEGLFAQDPEVTVVQTDPHPDNRRAIACNRAAGFVEVGEVRTPDGPALLMKVRRPPG